MAVNTRLPKLIKIPANIAAASEAGIRRTKRSNQPAADTSSIRPPAKIKPATASLSEMPLMPAIKAAPGVHQAIITGAL